MDAGRGSSHLNGETGPSSPFCPWENDSAYRPWHSTPVRKSHQGAASDASQLSVASKSEMERMARQPSKSPQASYLHNVQDSQTRAGEMEFATIQRQRKELQLLIAELKDRDQELNTMATSHQKQLQAWEQDRQRVLTLEQRATRLDDELHKRNELIRLLTKRVQMVETRERETSEALSATKQWLHEAEQKHQHASQTYQDLEAKNQSLNSTVMALSTQVGSLQVREEELRSMLQLKDKDVSEVTAHIVDVTERLRELETSQKESRAREDQLSKDLVESRRRYRQARHENERLKEELQLQVTQGSAQREEIIRLKQEGQLLRRDLALTGEGESWKDELLGLSRSKQERMDSELHSLRQVCENQQNELQLLQLNLETAREALKQKKDQGSLGRETIRCKSVSFVETDSEGNSPGQQAVGRILGPRQNTQEEATTEQRGCRETDTDGLSDKRMTAAELTTSPIATCLNSVGQSYDFSLLPQSRMECSAPGSPIPSEHMQAVRFKQAGQDKESMDSFANMTATEEVTSQRTLTSQGDSSGRRFSSTQSMTQSNRGSQFTDEYGSQCIQPGGGTLPTETEPSTHSCVAQLNFSGHTTICSPREECGAESFEDYSLSNTSCQNVDRAHRKSGRGKRTADNSLKENTDGVGGISDFGSCRGGAGALEQTESTSFKAVGGAWT